MFALFLFPFFKKRLTNPVSSQIVFSSHLIIPTVSSPGMSKKIPKWSVWFFKHRPRMDNLRPQQHSVMKAKYNCGDVTLHSMAPVDDIPHWEHQICHTDPESGLHNAVSHTSLKVLLSLAPQDLPTLQKERAGQTKWRLFSIHLFLKLIITWMTLS